MDKSKKSTYIIAAVSLIIIMSAVYFLFIFHKSPKGIETDKEETFVEKIEKIEISKRPYVTLTPTADGAEIIISIESMNFFDKIEYELTYLADNPQIAGEKIQRGSVEVDVDTKQDKYKKSLLLGTASRGVRSPDTGLTDGKLTLHLFKGDTEYVSESVWDRFEAGSASREISDSSGKFEITAPKLGKNYWVIIADTVGVPPNSQFDTNTAVLPIFGTFSVAPVFKTLANFSIKVENNGNEPKLYTYNHQDSAWKELDAAFANNTLSGKVDAFTTFVVVSQ